jgi:hypothetical protein
MVTRVFVIILLFLIFIVNVYAFFVRNEIPFLYGQPLTPFAVITIIVVSGTCLYLLLFKPHYLIGKWYICPKCELTKKSYSLKTPICEKCNSSMVELKGYYSS